MTLSMWDHKYLQFGVTTSLAIVSVQLIHERAPTFHRASRKRRSYAERRKALLVWNACLKEVSDIPVFLFISDQAGNRDEYGAELGGDDGSPDAIDFKQLRENHHEQNLQH